MAFSLVIPTISCKAVALPVAALVAADGVARTRAQSLALIAPRAGSCAASGRRSFVVDNSYYFVGRKLSWRAASSLNHLASPRPFAVEAAFAWDSSENVESEGMNFDDGMTFEQRLLCEQLRRAFTNMSDEEIKAQTLDILRLQMQEANIWAGMLQRDFGYASSSNSSGLPSEEMVETEQNESSVDMNADQSFRILRLQQLMEEMSREEVEQTWLQVYTEYCKAKNEWKANLTRLSGGGRVL